MDWSRFADQGTTSPEQTAREARTLQELRAYTATFSQLLDALAELRRGGRELSIDEGGRHIFVTHQLRTIGIHRDNINNRLRVSGPGRFGPRVFPIPPEPEALVAWSATVVEATLEMLLAP
jgi:hypothetical protein